MSEIHVGIHLPKVTDEYILLNDVDEKENISYLKKKISEKIELPEIYEIIYNGKILSDETKIGGNIPNKATIHCFPKPKSFPVHKPMPGLNEFSVMSSCTTLFLKISNAQININSRVNILQKILTAYPELRRNLGAQAIIRDSVLFNSLHHKGVMEKIYRNYPVICDATPFIVDAIKKELARNSNAISVAEQAADSTTSSEEENSVGASSSSESVTANSGTRPSRSDESVFRVVSRQQLQNALASITYNSDNSLSNIAQRDAEASDDSTATTAETMNEEGPRRINAGQLSSVLESLRPTNSEQMETNSEESGGVDNLENNSENLPTTFRNHQYSEQLRTMAQMGFTNHAENLTYLTISNGNIEAAINLLMGALN